MLKIVRSVAREPLYRVWSPRFASRAPDDVWVDEQGWFVVFPLTAEAGEELLLFALREEQGAFAVTAARKVRRDPDGTVTISS
jgi:hypothetical protein